MNDTAMKCQLDRFKEAGLERDDDEARFDAKLTMVAETAKPKDETSDAS